MRWLEISTNINCSNNCVFCPQKKIITQYSKRSNEFQMSFETFKICIDKVPTNVTIIFSGMSEPWLNPNCTKMVMYAHQKGHRIYIYTSLVGIKVSDIQKLKTISFDYNYGFMVHLPSVEKIEDIKITKEYLKVLNSLIHSGIKAEYHYHGSQPNPKINLSGANVIYTPLQNRAGNLPFQQNFDHLKKGKIFCTRSLKANFLLPNGDVLLCCQDYGMKHVIGNLLKSNYQSIFKSQEYKKILKGMDDNKIDILCRTCSAYAFRQDNKSQVETIKKKIKIFFLESYLFFKS